MAFRTAVPDLRCEVEQMIITGDRVVSHLHFRGSFTGTFGKLKGQGQKIDFIATDIYQIREEKNSRQLAFRRQPDADETVRGVINSPLRVTDRSPER